MSGQRLGMSARRLRRPPPLTPLLCMRPSTPQDVNKEAGAEDMFKKIGEAYEVRCRRQHQRTARCHEQPSKKPNTHLFGPMLCSCSTG